MEKDEREWHAFRSVYRETDFSSVTHQDLPDFVVCRSKDSTAFGVEVTDVYETEADARIAHHPSYIGQLLSGADYMHRDDLRHLPLAKVTISDSDGNVKSTNVPAIARPTPTHFDRAQAIAAALSRKNRRVATYRERLDHVSLIAVDHFSSQLHSPEGYYTSDLINPELRTTLLESGFREVYLVSKSRDGSWYYRPLQMLLLMERFYLFLGALESFESSILLNELEVSDLVPLFIATNQGDMTLHYCDSEPTPFAFYLGSGIYYSESHGIRVLDHLDFQLPAAASTPTTSVPNEQLRSFQLHLSQYVENNVFHTALSFNADTK